MERLVEGLAIVSKTISMLIRNGKLHNTVTTSHSLENRDPTLLYVSLFVKKKRQTFPRSINIYNIKIHFQGSIATSHITMYEKKFRTMIRIENQVFFLSNGFVFSFKYLFFTGNHFEQNTWE